MNTVKNIWRYLTGLILVLMLGDKAIPKDDDDPTIGIRG